MNILKIIHVFDAKALGVSSYKDYKITCFEPTSTEIRCDNKLLIAYPRFDFGEQKAQGYLQCLYDSFTANKLAFQIIYEKRVDR